MATNKPEVFTFNSLSEECVRLTDYETLQAELADMERDYLVIIEAQDAEHRKQLARLRAECERWKNAAHGAHRQLTANRLETEKLAVDWSKGMAECEKLRAAIRRLCNIYVVDDYYDGQLREERLERAVNRAINAAMQETNP